MNQLGSKLSWLVHNFSYQDGDLVDIKLHQKSKKLTGNPVVAECMFLPNEVEETILPGPGTRMQITLTGASATQPCVPRSGLGYFKARVGAGKEHYKRLTADAKALRGLLLPNLPVMLIPGFASSALKVVKGQWEGERLWISMAKLTSAAFSQALAIGSKKYEVTNPWLRCMSLGEDGICDPPNIQVRAETGLDGCSYLEAGTSKIATEFTYVMGMLTHSVKFLFV